MVQGLLCSNLTLSTTSPGLGEPLRVLFRQTKLTECHRVQVQVPPRPAQGREAPLRGAASPRATEEKSCLSFLGSGSLASPWKRL